METKIEALMLCRNGAKNYEKWTFELNELKIEFYNRDEHNIYSIRTLHWLNRKKNKCKTIIISASTSAYTQGSIRIFFLFGKPNIFNPPGKLRKLLYRSLLNSLYLRQCDGVNATCAFNYIFIILHFIFLFLLHLFLYHISSSFNSKQPEKASFHLSFSHIHRSREL